MRTFAAIMPPTHTPAPNNMKARLHPSEASSELPSLP